LSGFWRNVATPFQRGWRWINEARTKRSYQNLWWGLPALIIALIGVGLGVLASVRASDHSKVYRQLAIQSYQEGDFKSARVFLERIYRDGDNGNEVTFFLASTLDGQGESQRANAMVDSLSPDSSVGYPDAHLLKAKILLAPTAFKSKSEAERAFHHLDAAQSKFRSSADWLSLKGKFYLMVNQPEQAVRYLREAAKRDPNLLYEVGMVYKKLGRGEEASDQLDLAHDHFKGQLASDTRNHSARMNLGSVLSEQGHFDQAFEVLTEGLSLDQDAGFGEAIARVCLTQYKLLLAADDTNPVLRLKLLRNALKYDRNSAEAVRLLAFFGEEAGSTPETQKVANDFLESMVATGTESPIAHLALGSKAWKAGNQADATFHLQRAYKSEPGMVVLANNLAWVLAHQSEPDLEQALGIMNTLLVDHPNIPHFRDTRGQILTKMGRWSEALDDLEYALRNLPKVPEIHSALATVYLNISPARPKLAQKHQMLEKAIRAASSTY
jgi:tetratricopeptide (TPR) repeat protein